MAELAVQAEAGIARQGNLDMARALLAVPENGT
jgi:hypothetical protein